MTPAKTRTIIMWLTVGALALALLFVVAIGYTAVALPGCESCHLVGEFATETAASAHSSVACVDCHVEDTPTGRVSFAMRELFHMVIPLVGELDRSYAAVPAERCVPCHTVVDSAAVVGSQGLRILHVSCTGARTCTDCHSLTGHGAATRWPRTAQMEDCYDCHGTTNDVTACDSCHVEREERERVFVGPFRVTHGPEWEATHGMGDMRSCSACHEADKCAGCHGAGVPHGGPFLERHAEFSASPEAQCTSCHRQEFCDSCHSYPMPHDVAFITGHSAIVETDGEERCMSCHEQADCTDCHVSHVHPVTQEQMDSFLRGAPEGGGSR